MELVPWPRCLDRPASVRADGRIHGDRHDCQRNGAEHRHAGPFDGRVAVQRSIRRDGACRRLVCRLWRSGAGPVGRQRAGFDAGRANRRVRRGRACDDCERRRDRCGRIVDAIHDCERRALCGRRAAGLQPAVEERRRPEAGRIVQHWRRSPVHPEHCRHAAGRAWFRTVGSSGRAHRALWRIDRGCNRLAGLRPRPHRHGRQPHRVARHRRRWARDPGQQRRPRRRTRSRQVRGRAGHRGAAGVAGRASGIEP